MSCRKNPHRLHFVSFQSNEFASSSSCLQNIYTQNIIIVCISLRLKHKPFTSFSLAHSQCVFSLSLSAHSSHSFPFSYYYFFCAKLLISFAAAVHFFFFFLIFVLIILCVQTILFSLSRSGMRRWAATTTFSILREKAQTMKCLKDSEFLLNKRKKRFSWKLAENKKTSRRFNSKEQNKLKSVLS
jgi:hypothetical protein